MYFSSPFWPPQNLLSFCVSAPFRFSSCIATGYVFLSSVFLHFLTGLKGEVQLGSVLSSLAPQCVLIHCLFYPYYRVVWSCHLWFLNVWLAHSGPLAWQIPWMEEPDRLQSMGSLGVRLRDFTFTFHFHALEKEIAIHSSILAWRIPGTEEPSRLQSMGSHGVGYNSAYTEDSLLWRSKVEVRRSVRTLPHGSKREMIVVWIKMREVPVVKGIRLSEIICSGLDIGFMEIKEIR